MRRTLSDLEKKSSSKRREVKEADQQLVAVTEEIQKTADDAAAIKVESLTDIGQQVDVAKADLGSRLSEIGSQDANELKSRRDELGEVTRENQDVSGELSGEGTKASQVEFADPRRAESGSEIKRIIDEARSKVEQIISDEEAQQEAARSDEQLMRERIRKSFELLNSEN